MTHNEIIERIAKIKAAAEVAKKAAAKVADTGLKICDGNHAKRVHVNTEGESLLFDLMAEGFKPVAVTANKEAVSRPGTAPVSFRMEIPVSIEVERARAAEQAARLKAARDLTRAKKLAGNPTPKNRENLAKLLPSLSEANIAIVNDIFVRAKAVRDADEAAKAAAKEAKAKAKGKKVEAPVAVPVVAENPGRAKLAELLKVAA
jgi:hypothetical protein